MFSRIWRWGDWKQQQQISDVHYWKQQHRFWREQDPAWSGFFGNCGKRIWPYACIFLVIIIPSITIDDLFFKFSFLANIKAVQPVSGNVIYDTFKDTSLRQELETRLEHINPVDLLIPGNLSENSKKCIQDWSNQWY